MYLRILDIQKEARTPFVLAKCPNDAKDFNLYIAPLPPDATERIRNHGKLRPLHKIQHDKFKKINSFEGLDRTEAGFHLLNFDKTRAVPHKLSPIHKSAKQSNVSHITCEESDNTVQFDGKVTRFGKRGFQCISFTHRVIRATWKHSLKTASSEQSKFRMRNLRGPKPEGSFIVLTSDHVLRLFVIRNGKPFLSLSITIDNHNPKHLKWIWVSSCTSKKNAVRVAKRPENYPFSDIIVWSSKYSGGRIIAIYRINGLDSANMHVWADCMLQESSFNVDLRGMEIVNATYSLTGMRFIACRLVDNNKDQFVDNSSSGWVKMSHNNDNYSRENIFSKILPPLTLILCGKNDRVKMIIAPIALLKSSNDKALHSKHLSCNQIKSVKYGFYKMSMVPEHLDSDVLATLSGISGYIKSISLPKQIDYKSTIVTLYPSALHVYLMECLNPSQTLLHNFTILKPWCQSVAKDISAVTLGKFSIISILFDDAVSFFILKNDLSVEYLTNISVSTESVEYMIDFRLWYVNCQLITLQIGDCLISLEIKSDDFAADGKLEYEVVRHEYAFPARSLSECDNFLGALIKFGQFTLLRKALELDDSNEHLRSLEILNLLQSNCNVDWPGPSVSAGCRNNLAKYFVNAPWDDCDFRDFDIKMLISSNFDTLSGPMDKRVLFKGSSFASAQFKLLATIISNCSTDELPSFLNLLGESASMAFWGVMYGQDSILVDFIISKFSGRDDFATLVHKFQVGEWVLSKATFDKLADWMVKEFVRVFKSQKSDAVAEDMLDQLGLWCILSNKLKLYSSIIKLRRNEKLANFFLNDFNDEQWKKNAEKNAFASISKRRYHIAIGFFILADKWEDAISLVDQRLFNPSMSLLLQKFSPKGRNSSLNSVSEASNSAKPFNFIADIDEITVQDLLNFSATFGPHALFFVACKFGIDYFYPLLVQKIIPFDIIPMLASVSCNDIVSVLRNLSRFSCITQPSISMATMLLAHSLWHCSPTKMGRALKIAIVALYSYDGKLGEPSRERYNSDFMIALLYLLISLSIIANCNFANLNQSRQLIAFAKDALEGKLQIKDSIDLLSSINFLSYSRPKKFLGGFDYDDKIESLLNLRILFYNLAELFNLLHKLRRLNELNYQRCDPIYGSNVDGENTFKCFSGIYSQFSTEGLNSQSKYDIDDAKEDHLQHNFEHTSDETHSIPVSLRGLGCHDFDNFLNSSNLSRSLTREYYKLDILQRLQWELCEFADDFSAFLDKKGESRLGDFISHNLSILLENNGDKPGNCASDNMFLVVPSGELVGITDQMQLNELISFMSGPISGLLFKGWVCKSEPVSEYVEHRPKRLSLDGCNSGCLFTICSLLKKLKGKTLSSLSCVSSSANATGIVVDGLAVLVTSVSDPDALRPGVYKVDVSLADSFTILHTLSECQISIALSQNLGRMALVDSFGWVNVYKIPHSRGTRASKSIGGGGTYDKATVLSGIHNFTFKCGDYGKSLAWVIRGNNQGPMLVTITGHPVDKAKRALDLESVGGWVAIGEKRYPNNQQLSLWMLYAGNKGPKLGISAAVDSSITLNCLAAFKMDCVCKIFIGDSKGYLRVLDISGNMIRVSRIIRCFNEQVVEIISCDEYLLVLGAKGLASILPYEGFSVDVSPAATGYTPGSISARSCGNGSGSGNGSGNDSYREPDLDTNMQLKIVSLLDNLEMTCIKSARLASSRLLVMLGKTNSDRMLIHHTHLPTSHN